MLNFNYTTVSWAMLHRRFLFLENTQTVKHVSQVDVVKTEFIPTDICLYNRKMNLNVG